MKHNRRQFIRLGAFTSAAIAGGEFLYAASGTPSLINNTKLVNPINMAENESIIGLYGPWATKENGKNLPLLSFRNEKWKSRDKWQAAARKVTMERMGVPDLGKNPEVKVNKQYTFDDLHIEEQTWQLPYGRATEAILLKPANAQGKLPAILAFHDHGGNKYFGTRKITRTSDQQHPLMKPHQEEYYGGTAWANEIAKRGYVVLVPDSFTFASRRVMMQDVPEHLRDGLTDDNPEDEKNINAYNRWASDHEHIMAKSLFSAGTTWPGVFFAEDRKALDILSARSDVDATRVGCCGLSGGGLRTDYMAGLDDRIKCAVSVGFMSTWDDFALNKSFTHTWMTYIPILPKELDFPEILGLRAPLPTLVQNDIEDQLYTIDQMRKADEILKQVYTKAGAADKYKATFYPGPHKFDREMQKEAFEWFDRWLK